MLLYQAFTDSDRASTTLLTVSNINSDFIREMIRESRGTGNNEYMDSAERIRDFAVSVNYLTDDIFKHTVDLAQVINSNCRGYLRVVPPTKTE